MPISSSMESFSLPSISNFSSTSLSLCLELFITKLIYFYYSAIDIWIQILY